MVETKEVIKKLKERARITQEENQEINEELRKLFKKDKITLGKGLEALSTKYEIKPNILKEQYRELEKRELYKKEEREKITYGKEQVKEAEEKFKSPKLIELIHQELSKTHIGDDKLKMTTFLCATSGLLKDQKKRMSNAITGNSSEGKDNEIKTSLLHMPLGTFLFLTSGTQSTIEDDIGDYRIIAFSEVNAGRENGANKFLTEVIKQKTEGGTSSLKKDIRTGMKTARHSEGEQACVLYGTTEATMDEEMQTRFIKGTILTDARRIKLVNDNTFDSVSDLDNLVDKRKEKDSWIRVGLTEFFNQKEQYEILIPYAKYLKGQINGEDIFDNNDPRSQRDIKRILSLTCAMTYLFQKQRKIIEYKGVKILVSEVQDFLNTLKISSEFFNQSYVGLDERCNKVIEVMRKAPEEWVARDHIQEQMNVTRNTIKEYCKTLADNGEIEGNSGKDLNYSLGVNTFNGNKIYYKRCHKGVKKPLLRCQFSELVDYFKSVEELNIKNIDTLLIPTLSSIKNNDKNISTTKTYQNKGVNLGVSSEQNHEKGKKTNNSSEIDTFSLTPSKTEPKTITKTDSDRQVQFWEAPECADIKAQCTKEEVLDYMIKNPKATPIEAYDKLGIGAMKFYAELKQENKI